MYIKFLSPHWAFSPWTGTQLEFTRLLSQKGRFCEGILRILRGSSDASLQNTLASSKESTASSLTKLSPTSCWNITVYSVPYHFLSIKSPASLSCALYSLQQKGSVVFLQFVLKEIYTGMVKTPSFNKTAGIQKLFFPNSAQAQERTGWSPSSKHEARLETW